ESPITNLFKKVSLLSFVVKAAIVALKKFPMFNASIDHEKEIIILKKYYNIGIAVETERGLIVPVLKDADRIGLTQITANIADLAKRARESSINVNELSGSTFTVTNIGFIGGKTAVPIINYPDVAILAMNKVEEKPIVKDSKIIIQTMLPLTLVFDHRIIDGADAAHFMNEITRLLSKPNELFLEM
ncbi:MAG: 2-oxo acid dehydrogenase subunit E2, partial [Oligoflexia bacterium]|nr:2-oxo acid dehydrogenase subunit E2 [Oligoflexia bacterium]